MLTLERLKEVLVYDSETGLFRWRITRGGSVREGKITGSKPSCVGYGAIKIDGKLFYSHRLAWFYMQGRWPSQQIDHVNVNRTDNRWVNLREASVAQNRWNEKKRKNNTSGYKGVSWNKQKQLWESYVGFEGKKFMVGYFTDPEAAHLARMEKAKEFHSDFARAA